MNDKNYLTGDLIPKPIFQTIVLGFLVITMILIAFNGYREYQATSKFFEDESTESQSSVYEIGYLHITKVNHSADNNRKTRQYVTITGLSYPISEYAELSEVQMESNGLLMPGLVSHPSFVVTDENKSFWKSQFYWVLAYHSGGYLLLCMLIFAATLLRFRQGQKLFTKELKYAVYAFYGLIMAGYFLYAVIFGRMIHFLNQSTALNESLTAGISPELLNVGVVLLILIVLIEQAIPIQEEQNLTV